MPKPIKHIAIVDAGKNTAFIDAVLALIQDRYQFKMVHPEKLITSFIRAWAKRSSSTMVLEYSPQVNILRRILISVIMHSHLIT